MFFKFILFQLIFICNILSASDRNYIIFEHIGYSDGHDKTIIVSVENIKIDKVDLALPSRSSDKYLRYITTDSITYETLKNLLLSYLKPKSDTCRLGFFSRNIVISEKSGISKRFY